MKSSPQDLDNDETRDDTKESGTVRGLPRESREEALAHARAAVETALDKKGLEPVLMEVGNLCSYAEYILVVSGRSDRQVDAIGEAIAQLLKERGLTSLGVEGLGSGQWVLVDFGEIITHVFHHPMRVHYSLESLWNEAPRVELDIPDEARVRDDDYF